MKRRFTIADQVHIGPEESLLIVAGPCAIESRQQLHDAAQAIAEIRNQLQVSVVFKASFDKANRSRISSFRGLGIERGLALLQEVRERWDFPLLTDVHEPHQCEAAAAVCHVLQIPAFLCRQTDLLLAAARTGRAVNVKKGQFLAPDEVAHIVEKIRSVADVPVLITERGTSFGYHDLVVDFRGIPRMQQLDVPVIFDVTHSLQQPGAKPDGAGGVREFAEPLARAAVAAGADGVFLEIHPYPDRALSDRETQLDPARAGRLLASLIRLREAMKEVER